MAEVIAPGKPLTVRQAATEVVAEQTRELRRQGKRALNDSDVEAVHQMRVATRRLRAALRVFRGFVVPGSRVRQGLRRLARRLGAVRDYDVLIGLIEEKHLGALRGDERQRLGALVARWRGARERSQRRLTKELGRARHRKLLAALGRLARRPRMTEGGDEEALAARVIADAVERQADDLSRHAAMTVAAPPPAALHDLRIAFKRLRYTLDFHAAAAGLAYDVERKLARQMQEVLGEIHDRDLLLDRLAGGHGLYAGHWPGLHQRLASERQRLVRTFLRLRKQWRAQTREPGAAEPVEPRFTSLEPARVKLRLVSGARHVASSGISW